MPELVFLHSAANMRLYFPGCTALCLTATRFLALYRPVSATGLLINEAAGFPGHDSAFGTSYPNTSMIGMLAERFVQPNNAGRLRSGLLASAARRCPFGVISAMLLSH